MPTVAELILKKIPMPTALGSADIRTQIAAEIRRRAFFSARMTSMTYIKMLQNICAAFAEGRINAADARLHCREALAQVGIFPGGAKGLADPAGRRRLELILKTQKKMATSVARINEDRLHPTRAALFPAWRLERYGSRSMPREDWAQRWKAAGDAVAWQGACRDRMVALKSSPIWAALGNGAGGFTDTLGNPYPPFAYSSGLDWTDVSEEEALRLGLQPDGGPLPGVSLAPSDREILMAMKSTGLSAEQLLPPEGAVMNKQHPFYKCPKCGKFTGYDGHCSKCGHVLPQDEMIQRGKEALKKATTGKEKSVKGAMYKEGLGRIDFWLGYEEGGPKPEPKLRRKSGHGLKKLGTKHFSDLAALPETIAKGDILPHWNEHANQFDIHKYVILHGDTFAIVSYMDGGWAVDTHYTNHVTAENFRKIYEEKGHLAVKPSIRRASKRHVQTAYQTALLP